MALINPDGDKDFIPFAMDDPPTSASPTYVLNDLGFLDKLSKNDRAEVLRNLRKFPGAKDSSADGQVTKPRTKCYFLQTIPLEVRNMIYELLLVNPFLGQAPSVHSHWEYGAKMKYRLEPAIIRTCQQISTEASNVLYAKNTFFISCVGPRIPTPSLKDFPILVSPITRYTYSHTSTPHADNEFLWRRKAISQAFKGISNVRKWVLVVDLWPTFAEASHGLRLFCHLLCKSRANAIVVLIQHYNDIPSIQRRTGLAELDGRAIARSLQPLKSLRNLQSFLVREVQKCEVPDYSRAPAGFTLMSFPDTASELKRSLVRLVTGSSLRGDLECMNRCLVNYARSFERSEFYAAQMGTIILEDFGKRGQERVHQFLRTQEIFKNHPVESGLISACRQALNHDPDGFKQYRSQILAYLEPQYQRIANASARMSHFVKEKKRFIKPSNTAERTSGFSWMFAEGMIILEKYNEALGKRDMPEEIEVKIKWIQEKFEAHYDNLPIAVAM